MMQAKPARQKDARHSRARRRLAAGLLAVAWILVRPMTSDPALETARDRSEEPRTSPAAKIYSLVSEQAPGLDEIDRWRIVGLVHQESERQGFDPLLVLAMIDVESSFRFEARGPRGARGLIQIMPATARAVAAYHNLPWSGDAALHRPGINLRIGLSYLADLERQFQDPLVAMAAYNLGPSRVAELPLDRVRRAHYVRKVMSRYQLFLQRIDRV